MSDDLQSWVLATGNAGKLTEMADLLAPLGVSLKAQSEFDTPEAEETGLTFIENAILKARNACKHSGLPAIADDSGLEVDALAGQPGIYSARFAGVGATDADNNGKLLDEMAAVPDELRTARYRCCMVFMRDPCDPAPVIAEGTLEGMILEAGRGDGGFGYDPIFYVPSHDCSAAELTKAVKNRISHRGVAMQHLMDRLRQQVPV